MNWFGQIWAIAWKDVLIEMRTRQRLVVMGAFAVLTGLLFYFSIDHGVVRVQTMAAGLIWMTIVFSGLLGVGRTFALEAEDGAFQGLLLTPVPRDAIYLGKVLSNFILVSVLVGLILVVFGGFFRLNYGAHPVVLVGILALGTLGFVALATLFGAVAAETRLAESLVPVLLFPLLTPMIIFGVSATNRLLVGRPVSEVEGNIRILAAFALIALAAGSLLFRTVVED